MVFSSHAADASSRQQQQQERVKVAVVWGRVPSRHVASRRVASRHVASHHVASCHVASRRVTSRRVVSRRRRGSAGLGTPHSPSRHALAQVYARKERRNPSSVKRAFCPQNLIPGVSTSHCVLQVTLICFPKLPTCQALFEGPGFL